MCRDAYMLEALQTEERCLEVLDIVRDIYLPTPLPPYPPT